MSQENVEIVRRFIDATQRFFEAYWDNPRSIAEAVEADDLWPEYREALTKEEFDFAVSLLSWPWRITPEQRAELDRRLRSGQPFDLLLR